MPKNESVFLKNNTETATSKGEKTGKLKKYENCRILNFECVLNYYLFVFIIITSTE